MQKLTIGRLAEATGVHLETIRYYERIGLIQEPGRTAGGHRSYTSQDLERLRFIRCSRELGFGLDAIRDLLQLMESGEGACGSVQALTRKHLADIERKLTEMTRMKEALMRMLESCPSDPQPTDPCPILERISDCGSMGGGTCCS